jgi:hypothetical protein
LNQKLDGLEDKTPWQHFTVNMSGDTQDYNVFAHNPLACIKALFGDPAFAEKMSFAPEKLYADPECQVRIYHEMNTGNWWCETQIIISLFIPIRPEH